MSMTRDMAYALGGVPLVGQLPYCTGNYYFVDGQNGSDGNTGLKPQEAKKTIAAAVTVMNDRIDWGSSPWANDDCLVLMPSVYAENLTSLPYGCTIVGLGDAFDLNGERGATIKPAAGSPVDATSVINMRIHNVCFESPDASDAFEVDNLNRTIISNCLFTGLPGGSPTSVNGLEVVKDMTGSRISDCVFQVFNTGISLTADNGASKQITGDIIERSIVRGCDTAGIYFDANCVPSYTMINDCIVGDGSTSLALGLDDNSGQVLVANTMFEATANDPASGDGDSSYNNCYLNGALLT